jgi:hypothetical protein
MKIENEHACNCNNGSICAECFRKWINGLSIHETPYTNSQLDYLVKMYLKCQNNYNELAVGIDSNGILLYVSHEKREMMHGVQFFCEENYDVDATFINTLKGFCFNGKQYGQELIYRYTDFSRL